MEYQHKPSWVTAAYVMAEELLLKKNPALLAIDGRCGSGKSTLARWLGEELECDIIHMDDFYLPTEMRKGNWMKVPGGNMDFSRLLHEVLEPWRQGTLRQYRPFVCRTGRYQESVILRQSSLTIVEGSYSHHPMVREFYDKTVFLTCTLEEQTRRLQQREGERVSNFQRIWIPLEERYFSTYRIAEQSDWILDASEKFNFAG